MVKTWSWPLIFPLLRSSVTLEVSFVFLPYYRVLIPNFHKAISSQSLTFLKDTTSMWLSNIRLYLMCVQIRMTFTSWNRKNYPEVHSNCVFFRWKNSEKTSIICKPSGISKSNSVFQIFSLPDADKNKKKSEFSMYLALTCSLSDKINFLIVL